MKKFFVIAMAAMSLTVVSCKKEQVNIDEQAKVYAEKVIAAQESGDEAAIAAANKEMEDFANGKLSEEEQAKFKAAIEAIYADYAAKKSAEAAEAEAAAAEVADSTVAEVVEAVEAE